MSLKKRMFRSHMMILFAALCSFLLIILVVLILFEDIVEGQLHWPVCGAVHYGQHGGRVEAGNAGGLKISLYFPLEKGKAGTGRFPGPSQRQAEV